MFGLSVVGILVSIFSCMLVYQVVKMMVLLTLTMLMVVMKMSNLNTTIFDKVPPECWQKDVIDDINDGVQGDQGEGSKGRDGEAALTKLSANIYPSRTVYSSVHDIRLRYPYSSTCNSSHTWSEVLPV